MTDRIHAEVAACWDRNADQWTEDLGKGRDRYREFFTFPAFAAFLPPLEGLEVVDFGCGEGSNTRRLARMGARMTGLDLSAAMLDHARRAEQAEPLGATYRQVSFSADTGLPAASFDAVVSTLALMDAPDLSGAMREARRLLRPGGFLAFSLLHPCFITPDLIWLRNEEGERTRLGVSRYFDRAPFTEHWRFHARPAEEGGADFAVPRFPRTLGEILNPVTEAGLRLLKIEEPRPSAELCAAAPDFRRWRDHAAFLLMVMAEAP